MRSTLVLLFLLATLVGVVSCGDGSRSSGQPLTETKQETGAIGLQLDWSDAHQPTPNQSRAVIDCTALNVASLSAVVFSEANEEISTGGPWNCSEGSGTIDQVAVGDNYRVVLSAHNADGEEIYRGESANVSVQAGQTVRLSITMTAVDEPEQGGGAIEILGDGIDCTAMTAASLSAVVLSEAAAQITTGGPWDCSHEGFTIGAVPAGDNYTVVLSAYDADGNEVYRGETHGISVQTDQTIQVSVVLEAIVPSSVSLVGDGVPGAGSSFPHRFFMMQNKLFYVALSVDAGFELHVADPASGDVQLVKDIYPIDDALDRSGVVAPSDFVELNGWLYFRANNAGGYRLWRTDGTSANTEAVPSSANYFKPSELTVFDDKIYFAADSDTSGRELWVYDPGTGETQQVADIRPGGEGGNPHELTTVGGRLYFVANDGVNGYELWHTDATGTEAVLAQDFRVGAEGSYPENLVEVNGRLFCVANNGSQNAGTTPPTYASEVWMIYEAGGTIEARVTADINASNAEWSGSSRAKNLTWVYGSTLAFSAYEPSAGHELYLYDWGIDSVPRRITDLNPNEGHAYPANFVYLDGVLYFTAHNSNNVRHLWAYALQAGQSLRCLTAALPYPSPRDLTGFNQTLYFSATDGLNDRGLWGYDGSQAAPVVGSDGQTLVHSPANLIATPDRLFFTAFDRTFGEELFQRIVQ